MWFDAFDENCAERCHFAGKVRRQPRRRNNNFTHLGKRLERLDQGNERSVAAPHGNDHADGCRRRMHVGFGRHTGGRISGALGSPTDSEGHAGGGCSWWRRRLGSCPVLPVLGILSKSLLRVAGTKRIAQGGMESRGSLIHASGGLAQLGEFVPRAAAAFANVDVAYVDVEPFCHGRYRQAVRGALLAQPPAHAHALTLAGSERQELESIVGVGPSRADHELGPVRGDG